jgi:hypothetical protein
MTSYVALLQSREQKRQDGVEIVPAIVEKS